jgi:hypothetical protein
VRAHLRRKLCDKLLYLPVGNDIVSNPGDNMAVIIRTLESQTAQETFAVVGFRAADNQ